MLYSNHRAVQITNYCPVVIQLQAAHAKEATYVKLHMQKKPLDYNHTTCGLRGIDSTDGTLLHVASSHSHWHHLFSLVPSPVVAWVRSIMFCILTHSSLYLAAVMHHFLHHSIISGGALTHDQRNIQDDTEGKVGNFLNILQKSSYMLYLLSSLLTYTPSV